MIGYPDSPFGWSMTRGMARVLGVNITGAVIDGLLTRKELAVLVDRCQNCPMQAACTAWLAKVTSSAALPDFCANKADLESLIIRN